jgi:hypothetical protein
MMLKYMKKQILLEDTRKVYKHPNVIYHMPVESGVIIIIFFQISQVKYQLKIKNYT